MICEEDYEVVCLKACSCDETINFKIKAPTTGFYTISVQFNGTTYNKTIEVEEGETIEVENFLNESYMYDIVIYTEEDEVLEGKIYQLYMNPCMNV